MTLVDTSAWIHALRPDGDANVANRVRSLLLSGEAAWCPMIQLELWNGARGTHESHVLSSFDADLVSLPISDDVWRTARELARKARSRGKTVPATDILITACARTHSTDLLHADSHFDQLTDL